MNGYHAESLSYREYERLLIQLHQLVAEGKGDEDEAEAIRERMDEPGSRLTDAEVARLKAVSARLNQRSAGEIYQPKLAAETEKPRKPTIEEKLLAIALEIPPEERALVPSDLTDNLDHYIYGWPKK